MVQSQGVSHQISCKSPHWTFELIHRRVIVVTSSSKKERLVKYMAVGDFDLTAEDVKAIDDAGAEGQ